MSRPLVVLIAIEPDRGDTLRARLRLGERTSRVGSFDVWRSDLELHELFAGLPPLLRDETVRSAAVLDSPPPPDKQWVAVEWARKVVVSGGLEPHVQRVANGWDREWFFEPMRLAIYAPSLEPAVTTDPVW